jgi:hypothetical protein
MMCKKFIYLMFVFAFTFACSSYADVVIGDFEDGLDGWVLTGGSSIDISDIGATSGNSSLAFSGPAGGFVWAIQWEGLLDMTNAHTLSVDVTWVAAEWGATPWCNFKDMAINSDGPSGWSQYIPIDPCNPDWPGSWDPVNWGDHTRTLTWDISDYDATGATWMQMVFSSNFGGDTPGNYYIDNVQVLGAEPLAESEPTVPFSLQAVGDIELGNDSQTGPDSRSNGSGLGARDVDDGTGNPRRRVILISYDISALKGRGPVSNVSLSNFSHDQHSEVNVYGVIEDLDLLDVESLTWNTAPGVKNDPAPELNSPVVLDPNDLTDVLLTFSGPGETGVRFSTDTSDALADFINSDTDGIITLLIATSAVDTQLIIRARQIEGGTLLQGDIAPIANIIWVSDNKGYGTEPNLAADHGFVDLLRANGYVVDYKNEFEYIDGTQYWRTLDDDKIAELEAADLVIISRNGDSGSYSTAADNEPNKWNAVTTPILSLSAYMARVGKWGWLDGTSTFRAKEAMMQVIEPDHPVFAGVAIDPNGLVEATSAQYNMDWVTGVIDAGNGIILATRPEDGLLSIVTWEAGQTYFDGSLYTAGGPRMLFIAGTGSGNNAPDYSPDGAYNLTVDGETMFLNAVKYMLPIKPVDPGTANLVAYYPLDGDVLDASGNGLDGTIMGDPNFVEGVVGMALQFDGVDDYVDCGNSPLFDLTGSEVTLSLWVNTQDVGNGQDNPWFGKGDTSYMLKSFRSGNQIEFFIYDGGWNSSYANVGTEFNGSWHHVAGTFDGKQFKIYVDSAEAVSLDYNGVGIVNNNYNVAIGANTQASGRFSESIIDEAMIYNRVLSAEEILYLAGL